MKKYLLLLLIIVIPILLPYIHKGYFPTHDGEWAVVRLADMYREIRDRQFPPRYSGNLNFGYGYPLFNFTYPLPYYLGFVIHLFHIGFVSSVKLIFALSVVLSTFSMFLATKNLWRSTGAGVISAVLYVYFPYRMVDLFVRGSIGESVSLVFFPLLFYFVLKIKQTQSKIFVILAGVSFALLILSHNIMVTLFMPILIIFIITLLGKDVKAYKPFITFLILGLGLSAFFFVPALLEKHNILLSVVPIADRNLYYVKILQLIIPSWGYGVPGEADSFSYQIGVSHLAVFITAIIAFVCQSLKTKNKRTLKIPVILICLVLIALCLLFPFSALFWKLPLFSEINYPWTLLAPIGFLISLLSGYLFVQSRVTKYLVIFLAAISIILVLPYAKPQYYTNRGDDYYATNDATTTSSSELMPLWVKQKPLQRQTQKVEVVKGNAFIDNLDYNSKKTTFTVLAKESSIIALNTIYYPGWKATVDSIEVSIAHNNTRGIMEIPIAGGNHRVQFTFSETPLRLVSDIVSILSLLAIAGYWLMGKFAK